MAEKIKLNLNDLIGKTLHCHPYLRIDGALAGNDEYTRQTEKKNGVYTSPRNIRKIFIKSTGIDVVYYRPIVGKGDSLCEFIPYSESDKKAIRLAFTDIAYKLSSGDSGYLEQVSIAGTGFSTFLKDLSLSNLEELYFDKVLLLGNMDLFYKFYSRSVQTSPGVIVGLCYKSDTYYNEINTVNQVSKNYVHAKSLTEDYGSGSNLAICLYDYVKSNICSSNDEMSLKYPRLKYIGFISNSNYQLKSRGALTKEEILNYGKYNVFDYVTLGLDLNTIKSNLCSNDMFTFSMFISTNVDLYSSNFRVDTATYQFDKDFLYDYFKCSTPSNGMTREAELTKWYTNGLTTRLGLESKLWWAKQFREGQLSGQKRAAQGLSSINDTPDIKEEKKEELDSIPRTELETMFNMIYNENGEDGGYAAVKEGFQMLLIQIGKSEVYKSLDEFSPGGKKIYSKIFAKVLEDWKE